MLGAVDFDVHHRLEKSRARLLHGFLEGQRARDLESHIRGVDIMILAVVEDRAEVHYGKSRQVAAGSGIADAFLDRRNPVLGDGAAKYIVDKLHTLAA